MPSWPRSTNNWADLLFTQTNTLIDQTDNLSSLIGLLSNPVPPFLVELPIVGGGTLTVNVSHVISVEADGAATTEVAIVAENQALKIALPYVDVIALMGGHS